MRMCNKNPTDNMSVTLQSCINAIINTCTHHNNTIREQRRRRRRATAKVTKMEVEKGMHPKTD